MGSMVRAEKPCLRRPSAPSPTGAKGLNLAASDVDYLFTALLEHYQGRSNAGMALDEIQ
jgi:2-polyprenyl-6-methoxyphenol hydroxylase-like FAD-dependent oxidoreductase